MTAPLVDFWRFPIQVRENHAPRLASVLAPQFWDLWRCVGFRLRGDLAPSAMAAGAGGGVRNNVGFATAAHENN
jgi:hypothetical protein